MLWLGVTELHIYDPMRGIRHLERERVCLDGRRKAGTKYLQKWEGMNGKRKVWRIVGVKTGDMIGL